MVSFRLLVDPSAGLELDEFKNLNIEVKLLPHTAFATKKEDSREFPVNLNQDDHFSEESIKNLYEQGYLPSFSRPSLGEWGDIIKSIPDDKDILCLVMSQKVTNSLSTINTLKNILHRDYEIIPIDSTLLDNRFLIEDLSDSNFNIKEALDFIDLFTRKNRNYETYWIPSSFKFIEASNRGNFQDFQEENFKIIWCDEKGLLTDYPLKSLEFFKKDEAIKYLIDSHKGWKRLDISASFDIEKEKIRNIKLYAESLGIACRFFPLKPLYTIAFGTGSIELNFAKENFYLYKY